MGESENSVKKCPLRLDKQNVSHIYGGTTQKLEHVQRNV
jgi:hypothetical protein